MATDLSNDLREQVRAQTDIVGLISEAMSLQPRMGGREYAGLCPFHEDHDPSLRVYPDRQTYKCWVCNEGGDVFSWIQKREAVGFREALEILARRASIEIPKHSGRSDGSSENKAALFEVLVWAEGIFHQEFVSGPSGSKARDYIRSRGFTAETVRRFRVGYHPNDWEWLQRQARGKFSNDQLEAVKLIGKRDGDRGYYDNFVDRVVFPIRNERAQVVGFGGRVLPGADDSHGKYWNSPESPVFFKSRLVYGLDFAREGLKQSGTAVVTEGYTDCIMCHQHGLNNVVGTLGTALTDQHVTTLKRFVKKVVLVYDGDNAGQRAAEKAVERFVAQDVDLRIMTLPENKDPDEYLSAYGADAWRELADAAPEAWEYKFQTLRKRYTLDTVSSRQQVLDEMLTVLSVAPKNAANIREGMYLSNLAQRLGASEQQVRDRYRDLRGRTVRRTAVMDEPPMADEELTRLLSGKLTRDDRMECELLQILFTAPELGPTIQEHVAPDTIRHPHLRKLLSVCYAQLDVSTTPSRDGLFAAIEDGGLKRLAVWLDAESQAKRLGQKLTDKDGLGGLPAAGSPAGAGHETTRGASTAQAGDAPRLDDGCPLLLRRSIENLQWRREEQSHQRIAVQLSADGDGTRRLDESAAELLRKAAEFHQRRANKKAPV
ncbi:DNA primase [Caulifigura coniformis]|uniref:DNA primase n=1 Tax=Caulifigura coniformis TaxID=2527983 RepID=A0A517S7Z7_9PLAN|nr:DNA primase [Caulifigura coniformis]QDT52268.1 DNA primase [Caulifigura coniformis]